MNAEKGISRYASLSTDQQIRFLSRLAAEITVWARETYEVGTDEIVDGPRLRAFNEFQHRVTGQLGHLIDGSRQRYPDDAFAQIMLDYAHGARCEGALMDFIKRSEATAIVASSHED